MWRRIMCSIAWAVVSAPVAFLTVATVHAALQEAGFHSWNSTVTMIIAGFYALTVVGVPVLVFVLGLRGHLPGTRRSKQP